MSMHDAEGVSQRRWAQGIRPHEPLPVLPSLQHAPELQRLKPFPWPRNLFGEPATIEDLLCPEGWVKSLPTTCSRMAVAKNVGQVAQQSNPQWFSVSP